LDGEIVAASPLIEITLDDENPFLIMNEPGDTAYFNVYLSDPEGVKQRVYFKNALGEDVLEWTPANSENISFIKYHPTLPQDGVYDLLVQATDKTGNNSGKLDYKISFEVINKSTITRLINYPNPFSTRTQFIFTLTGDKVPDDIKIQIMTVSGRVIKEITEDEIGPIHIGTNRTEYWWEGTDEFGDKLANGLYLYKVITKIAGEEIELRGSEIDKYFMHDFGKMYIIR